MDVLGLANHVYLLSVLRLWCYSHFHHYTSKYPSGLAAVDIPPGGTVHQQQLRLKQLGRSPAHLSPTTRPPSRLPGQPFWQVNSMEHLWLFSRGKLLYSKLITRIKNTQIKKSRNQGCLHYSMNEIMTRLPTNEEPDAPSLGPTPGLRTEVGQQGQTRQNTCWSVVSALRCWPI